MNVTTKHVLTFLMRASLWLLLLPAAAIALMSVPAGLFFGFNLWRFDDPGPTLLWIAVLAFPMLIFHALRSTKGSFLGITLSFAGAWAFAAFYALVAFR